MVKRFAFLILAAGGLLASAVSPVRGQTGQLFAIGGGKRPPAVMQAFIREAAKAGQGRILVLPMASSEPGEVGRRQAGEIRALASDMGLQITVDVLNLSRREALNTASCRWLRDAAGIFISGGSQSRFMDVVHGTPFETALRQRFRDGAVIAGTSAGAAVQSKIMITGEERFPLDGDHPYSVLRAGNVVTRPGLGLIPDVIIDQHFVVRRRFNRLLSLVLENPRYLGVGIDESTAIWIRPDRTFEVLGDRYAVVLDASRAGVSAPNPWLEARGVQLHVLRAGARYDLDARRVIRLGGTAVQSRKAGGKGEP